MDMGGCQNYGPFLDPYYNTAPDIQGTQEGAIILTTTHTEMHRSAFKGLRLFALLSPCVAYKPGIYHAAT